MRLSAGSEHPCLQRNCADLDKAAPSTQPGNRLEESAEISNLTVQSLSILCSQEFKQSTLFLISLLQFAPWHLPTPTKVFPRAECEMPAVSSFPFIPMTVVTVISLSHAICCLQAAHVLMQVPADGAERKRIRLIVCDKSTLVCFFPSPKSHHTAVTPRGIPAHLQPYSIFSLLLHVPETDLLSPKHRSVTQSCPQHPTATSRSNCRVWTARGK